ncbi:TetR/AcrR family transcriptional regulator [Mucilaginibacter dorajii]|uniref:HTH tetR-type domain-containing protein n=1 Tax=Mucilaginibacter dorajii TaxID=692994 RepID=A0ABP7QXI0_9SPHI|nr:TetR/AcrR family transcriptional regulator [Mucilaginibacter dorajii]MCS3732450.1 AcrR family transcriptional regulator [Mucilaginibacter dorajii]
MKNKDETKQRIFNAIGRLFKADGINALYYANIAREAGVDRSLVYQYFGRNIKKLIEDYILQKDYWMKFFEKVKAEVGKNDHEPGKELIIELLQRQWEYLSADMEMQHLILWELTGDSDLMRSIHHTREMMAEPMLELAEQKFKGTLVKITPIIVLLLSGIYYANIHAVHNGSVICGIDVRSIEGQADLLKAIQQIIEWAYEHAA